MFDPSDPKHYIIANDGGLYESWDGLKTFRHFTNLPLSQFYRVSTDNAKPFYHVCGGAQDNGSVCGPSRTLNRVGIRTSDWIQRRRRRWVPGREWIRRIQTSCTRKSQEGALQRLDLRTGQSTTDPAELQEYHRRPGITGSGAGGHRGTRRS